MAGDWIKFEVTTPDKPEVFAIADILKIDPDAALGKLMRVWSWFDQHLENGNDASVTAALLDRLASQPGFASAMQEVGWLVQTPLGYDIPHFDRHNGKTAKTRALTAKRVAAHKDRTNDECNDLLTPVALPREEKRREEKETTTVGGKVVDLLPSNIPYKEIVALHNEHMGKLPMVREMTKKRRDLIRNAWHASKQRQTLKFWQAYFSECSEDDFLNGTGPYNGKGHENWRPTFDYLMRNEVITRVYEKAMSRES